MRAIYPLMNTPLPRFVRLLPVLAAGLVGAGNLHAQDAVVTTVLHTFIKGSQDGWEPHGRLLRGSDGNFYGTTRLGGVSGYGTVFKVTPDGTYTVLHSFDGVDGRLPDTALVAGTDGNFYGTTPEDRTSSGETYAYYPGTMYRITPTGEYTVLHLFDGTPANGSTSRGIVLGPDGNFYGTATLSGIFRITPQGDYTSLSPTNSIGGLPGAALALGRDGNFYGTTIPYQPGTEGAIFSISTAGASTLLHSFDTANSTSAALIQGADGAFYGTSPYGGPTSDGGEYTGTVYRITLAGDYSVLHRFTDTYSSRPYTALAQAADGNLYGTASRTVFRLAPDGTFTLLTPFEDPLEFLNEVFIDQNQVLYGTTRGSFQTTGGVFYKMTIAPPPSTFFDRQVPVGKSTYYMGHDAAQPSGGDFGYYGYFEDRRYVYHFQLGFEYAVDAADGADGVYLYDFKSSGWFYTSPQFAYPYLYDFNLGSVVYYFGNAPVTEGGDPTGTRYFYVFKNGQYIAK